MRATFRLWALGGLVLVLGASVRAQGGVRTFPLTVHVAEGVEREDIDQRVQNANRLFGDAGTAFEVAAVVPLDARHARLVTRPDRDALGAYATPRTIDVFVVQSLVDVDTPPLERRGVHWRDRTRPGIRYVIVIASAGPFVLAHELGHYFGNGHSDVAGNLMSYTRGEGDPFLDAVQLGRIRRASRSLAQRFGMHRAHRHELKPVRAGEKSHDRVHRERERERSDDGEDVAWAHPRPRRRARHGRKRARSSGFGMRH